jgi:hypothetical protein
LLRILLLTLRTERNLPRVKREMWPESLAEIETRLAECRGRPGWP